MEVVVRSIGAVLLMGLLGLAGCVEWTQDSQGHLQSVGLPGVPVWQSSTPPPAVTPTQLGFAPDAAAQMSGPVLVIPSASGAYHYRFYQNGQNHCAEDVQKMMAARVAIATSDPAPYCTDQPTEPPARGGSFMGF
jgi:hypothetical protein